MLEQICFSAPTWSHLICWWGLEWFREWIWWCVSCVSNRWSLKNKRTDSLDSLHPIRASRCWKAPETHWAWLPVFSPRRCLSLNRALWETPRGAMSPLCRRSSRTPRTVWSRVPSTREEAPMSAWTPLECATRPVPSAGTRKDLRWHWIKDQDGLCSRIHRGPDWSTAGLTAPFTFRRF